MNIRCRHLIAPVAVLAVLAFVPAAGASPTSVLRACLNQQSLDGFSDADKRAALNQMPADSDEYSDCRSVIGASIGGPKKVKVIASSAPPSGGSPDQETPKARRAAAPEEERKARQARQQQARKEARQQRARKVRERRLGQRAVDPKNADVLKAATTANGLPMPVMLAVVALGLLALAGGTLMLARHNPRVAGLLRRVPLPRFRR